MRCYANETMTCVGRHTGENVTINGNVFHFAMYRNGSGNQLYLTLHWPDDAAAGVFQDILQCTVGDVTYSFMTLNGWEDPVCVIPYLTDGTRYALIPKGKSNRLADGYFTITEYVFEPGQYTTLPTLALGTVNLIGNYTQKVTWTLTKGDGRMGWVVSMELRYRDPGADTYTAEVKFSDSFRTYYNLKTDSTIVGKEACLVLEYRTYDSEWDGDDNEAFTTLNRMTTPWQLVERDAKVPLPPTSIGVSMLLAGGWVTVQWSAVTDTLCTVAGYWLERAVNGSGTFTRLYSGASTQYRDTLPADAETVEYRVCSVSAAGKSSAWYSTGRQAVAQSNLYVCSSGTWMRASGVWIGEKRASPMVHVK